MASSQQSSTDYAPIYPSECVVGFLRLQEFISNFYRASDVSGDVDDWVKLFAEGAFVKMGDGPSAPDQISLTELRKSMWKDVKARKHTVTRAFPATFRDSPAGDLAFATFGSVKLELKVAGPDGSSSREREWSAYGQIHWEDGVYKLAHYHVYFG